MSVSSIQRDRLGSSDEETRRAAVASLSPSIGDEALALLVVALGDHSWRVRKEAVLRVSEWRPAERAARILVEALAEPENVGRRNAAVEALARMGGVVITPLVAALAGRPAHRKLIADALGTVGDARGVAPLGRLLDDFDENVRVAAAEALGKIGGQPAQVELTRALGRGELLLGIACLDALHRTGAQIPVASLEPLLVSPALRPAAVEALGGTRDLSALPHLVAALAAPTRGVRTAAIGGLVRLHGALGERGRRAVEEGVQGMPEAAERSVIAALLEAAPPTRRHAAWLLGVSRRVSAVRPLALALGDPEVSDRAGDAIAALGDLALTPLCALLPDLEPSVRARAFAVLPRLATLSSVTGQVRTALGTAMAADEDPDVRDAARLALDEVSAPSPATATQTPTTARAARTASTPGAAPNTTQSTSQSAAPSLPVAGARPDYRMTDAEFDLFRDLINEHCGLLFDPDNKFLVEKRLSMRVAALGLASFGDYYRYLHHGAERRDEFEEIVERLTTNETYFFRERYQLDAFQYEILPALAAGPARQRRTLTLWSAGCATGEEAYSIAMLTFETGLFDGWQVRVFGTDISRRVLAIAKKGRYGRASFRQTEEQLASRFFRVVPEDRGRHQVRDEVRSVVTFYQANLLDEPQHALIGDVDVILCRNVLMYFDLESRRRVVSMFHGKLRHGGYLLLGHTESLMNLSTSYELLRLKNDMVYRKP